MTNKIYLRVQDYNKNVAFVSVVAGDVRYTSDDGTPLALSNVLGRHTFVTQARLACAHDAQAACAVLQAVVGKSVQVSVFEVVPPQHGYTVFLQQANGAGTTHISYQVGDRNAAVHAAIRECRADWGWNDDDMSDDDDDLRVLGVIVGDVDVLEWEEDA